MLKTMPPNLVLGLGVEQEKFRRQPANHIAFLLLDRRPPLFTNHVCTMRPHHNTSRPDSPRYYDSPLHVPKESHSSRREWLRLLFTCLLASNDRPLGLATADFRVVPHDVTATPASATSSNRYHQLKNRFKDRLLGRRKKGNGMSNFLSAACFSSYPRPVASRC